MSENRTYDRWLALAKAKGWKLPANCVFPDESWISYWQGCERADSDPSYGRPVAPHRSA
jgi:hypothetical protein